MWGGIRAAGRAEFGSAGRRDEFGKGFVEAHRQRGIRLAGICLVVFGLAGAGGVVLAEGLRGSVMPEARAAVVSDGLTIRETQQKASISLDFADAVDVNAFVLGRPYRVILDLPQIKFSLPEPGKSAKTGARSGKALIRDYRYGGFAPGRSRMVFDLSGPAVLGSVSVVRGKGRRRRVTVNIEATDPAQFAALEAAGLIGPPRIAGGERPAPRQGDARRGGNTQPVIVIDPGHGGLDPGAVAGKGVREKDVVLAVGQKVAAALRGAGRYKVLMTREGDAFLSLRERLDFSKEHGADLFVSLHADALAETEVAETVSGATVYTLSDQASDEAARRVAEKENAADLAAGLALEGSDQEDKVRGILYDLMRRETSAFSAEFRKILLKRMQGKVRLSRAPARSAAFAVLKQTETPSVLVELGYISNGYDRAKMTSEAWRKQAASSIVGAVNAYFRNRAQGGEAVAKER